MKANLLPTLCIPFASVLAKANLLPNDLLPYIYKTLGKRYAQGRFRLRGSAIPFANRVQLRLDAAFGSRRRSTQRTHTLRGLGTMEMNRNE